MRRPPMTMESEEPDELPADLRLQIAELPRESQPGRDLWPGIAARLAAPAAGQPVATAAAAKTMGEPKARNLGYRHLAAAALLAASLGAGSTWWLLRHEPSSAATTSASLTPSADGAPATAIPVSIPDWRQVEADYDRARASLWAMVQTRRDRLSASTLSAVERNLAILDAAIGELRQALAQDPGNPRLSQELLDSHRRSLDLLRRVTNEA